MPSINPILHMTLAAASSGCHSHASLVRLSRHAPQQGHRLVELLPINPAQLAPTQPHPLLLTHGALRRRATVTVLRDESLPLDTVVTMRLGEVALTSGPLWSWREPRGGLGAVLGSGPLGVDGAGCPGLGMGELGHGPLGIDGIAWRATLDDLPEGDHTIAITRTNAAGQPVAEPTHQVVTIDPLPVA